MRTSAAVSLALLSGCALFGGRPSNDATQLASANRVFVRNSFDKDPSTYIGRFVPRTAEDFDETAAMQLTCSQHVKYTFVEAGGVEYTETMEISSAAAAKIGMPLVASGQGSAAAEKTVQVAYTLTGKMIGNIEDPAAFAECCKSQPDQCTDRYIGEFLQGTGTITQSSSMNLAAGGQGVSPQGVAGEASASHDESHDRVIEFAEPVYFAFKLTETPYNRATSSCGAWVDTPPTEPGFVFFVGSSRPVRNERMARQSAQNRAMGQAIQSVAKMPTFEASESDEDTENDEAADGMELDTAAQQWARGMQVVESCVEVENGARGPRYVGRVLGKLPEYQGSEPTDAP